MRRDWVIDTFLHREWQTGQSGYCARAWPRGAPHEPLVLCLCFAPDEALATATMSEALILAAENG